MTDPQIPDQPAPDAEPSAAPAPAPDVADDQGEDDGLGVLLPSPDVQQPPAGTDDPGAQDAPWEPGEDAPDGD